GGNTFSGTYFGSLAGPWSVGNNVDDELKSFGIPAPAEIVRAWDTSFALGCPIVRDRVWVYRVTRAIGDYTDIAGRCANANAGAPARWDYVPDQSIKERSANSRKVAGGRVTAQASPRNKVSAYFDYQKVCNGSAFVKDGDQCRSRGDDWVAVGGF